MSDTVNETPVVATSPPTSTPTTTVTATGLSDGLQKALAALGIGKQDTMLGLTNSDWGTVSNLGGLAMKAFALPSQLDYYGTQTDLAKQQLNANKQAMADRKTFNANWANASNGLAGKSV